MLPDWLRSTLQTVPGVIYDVRIQHQPDGFRLTITDEHRKGDDQ